MLIKVLSHPGHVKSSPVAYDTATRLARISISLDLIHKQEQEVFAFFLFFWSFGSIYFAQVNLPTDQLTNCAPKFELCLIELVWIFFNAFIKMLEISLAIMLTQNSTAFLVNVFFVWNVV